MNKMPSQHAIDEIRSNLDKLVRSREYRLIQPDLPTVGFNEVIAMKPQYPIMLVGGIDLHDELVKVQILLDALLEQHNSINLLLVNFDTIAQQLNKIRLT